MKLDKSSNMQILKKAVKLIDDKKADDIIVLNIEGLSVIADYFIICSGRSIPQVKAITDHLVDTLKQEDNITIKGIEGQQEGKWVLVDYGDIVVHIFRQEEREFYNLERLWGDAKQLQIDEL